MTIANIVNSFRFTGDGVVGGWKELARTTLGSTSTSITVSSITNKRYYQFLFHALGSTSPATAWRFNSDSGTNYARRRSTDGGADVTNINQTFISASQNNITTTAFQNAYIANLSSKEKLGIWYNNYQSTAGAGTAPNRDEIIGKWDNTADAIDSVTVTSTASPLFATDTELVVLGWDPADTHTDNFWEELASVELGSTTTDLDSSTFTAKKYIWFQFYSEQTGSATYDIRFNVDSGNNYAQRNSFDGGVDATTNSINGLNQWGNTNFNHFGNYFIVNVSSNEKLLQGHYVRQNTAGVANTPSRMEFFGKWANTASQINQITLSRDSGTGQLAAGSIIKVWGSD